MKLATFDIFDTALVRRCGTPQAVWKDLAGRLFGEAHDLAEAFVAWRRHAKGETLAEIYAGIDSGFTDRLKMDAGDLMQAERETERSMLTANPAVRTLIEEKRMEGWQIAFMSDMYLDSAFLKQVLVEQGCAREEDRVYVSCEHHARKDTGTLYDVVRRELHPAAWEHCGDNLRSDVRMARRKGVRAIAADTGCNDTEKAIAGVSPCLAALSRFCRMEHPEDAAAHFAADHVVPAYLPYALFVLDEARRMGIKRLYFLSRDSYVLLKAAERLLPAGDSMELHYLFVSRRSLLLPYIYGEDETAYLAACDHHTLIRIDSVDKRLRHLGTSREELKRDYGIDFPYRKVNNMQEQADFLQKIFHSAFTPLLQRRAREQYLLLTDYFRQEGLCDGAYCAAVDVGWLGTSRLMMNRLLRRSGNREVHFFYYGVRGDALPPSTGRYTAYFQADELTTETTVLLEHYYSASPYPSTVGYRRRDDGMAEPVFEGQGGFRHTSVSKANEEAITFCAARLPENTGAAELRLWASTSMSCILNPRMRVDMTPLALVGHFDDNTPLVKRLGMAALFRFAVLGKRVTGFDLGSLRLTLPLCLLPQAVRLHRQTGRLRSYIYRKMRGNRL